jgi:hypothetical protein
MVAGATREEPPTEPPTVTAALERSADSTTARTVVARLVDAHPALADELAATPLLLDGVVALACASRALTSAVLNDPSLLDWLRDPAHLACERTEAELHATWVTARGVADPTPVDRSLRRWKRAEMTRIALRDLLGLADLPTVGRELAAGRGLRGGAVAIVDPAVPFAVVAMGSSAGELATRATSTCSSSTTATPPSPGRPRGDCSGSSAFPESSASCSGPTRTCALKAPPDRCHAPSTGYEASLRAARAPGSSRALLKAARGPGDGELGRQFLEAHPPLRGPNASSPTPSARSGR